MTGQFQTVALTFQFARKQSLTMHRALGEARDTDTAPTVRRALRISSVKGGIACDRVMLSQIRIFLVSDAGRREDAGRSTGCIWRTWRRCGSFATALTGLAKE